MLGFSMKAPEAPAPTPFWESPVTDSVPNLPEALNELSHAEALLLAGFLAFCLAVHLYGRATPMKKTAVLSLPALNRVNIFKECFLGYVNAGMLEPIMAIASSDYDVTTRSLVINVAQLLGLFSWLYLLSDAFDCTDTQQAFIYNDRLDSSKLPSWVRRPKGRKGDVGTGAESAGLRGSLARDLSLWFMLFCSLSAFCGIVSHRDVIHSHAIVLLWVMLHHQARQATAWRGTGYFHTLFAPSTALLPLEYCLNLIDQEMIGDDGLEDLTKWRAFIKAESGVELTIEA
jgi:hypothetical protein